MSAADVTLSDPAREERVEGRGLAELLCELSILPRRAAVICPRLRVIIKALFNRVGDERSAYVDLDADKVFDRVLILLM